MATPTKFIPFDQLVQMKGGELTPSEEYTRAYGGEGSYSPLLDYLLETGKPMSSITAPGGNTGNDPGLQAWIRNRVLAGRSPEDYIKSLNTGMGLGPTLEGNDQGGAWYDPATGQVGFNEFNESTLEAFSPLLTLGGMALGAGAISGALGGAAGAKGSLAGLVESGATGAAGGALEASALGASSIDSFLAGLPSINAGGGMAAYDAVAANDPVGALVQNLDKGMSSSEAISAVEAALPGTTQSTLQFLASNPSQLAQVAKSLAGTGGKNESDWTNILGKLLATGLGAYGASQQSSALTDLASKYQEYGAPSRARFEASMTPGFDPTTIPGYSGALDTASKSLLARLSAREGNPFGSPGGLIEANKSIVSGTALPAVSEYQRLNANTGFGSSMNAALNLSRDAIGSDKGVYDALGYGLNQITQPKQSLADLLKAIKVSGLV